MGKKREKGCSRLPQSKHKRVRRTNIERDDPAPAGLSSASAATTPHRYQLRSTFAMKVEEEEEEEEERRDELLDEMSDDMMHNSTIPTTRADEWRLGFEDVGGLSNHINTLREMVLFPLLYPAFFRSFSLTASRGILLCGPPGTGKTLVARAVASEARKVANVSFYMRKGADFLSKWLGETEHRLVELFDTAQKTEPSIIFFDEIDGLAPKRCSSPENAQNSIVSTLLALMDGLYSRGQVIILAATNRVDAIDPALRRPGRFDRELLFSLPDSKARCEILNIHTRNWKRPPTKALVAEMGAACAGYCGADLKALCTEAAIEAFKRRYPQAYTSRSRMAYDRMRVLEDMDSLIVGRSDFLQATSLISPAVLRGSVAPSFRPLLSPIVAPCLQRQMQALKGSIIKMLLPVSGKKRNSSRTGFYALGSSLRFEQDSAIALVNRRARLLVCGAKETGVEHVTSATLHGLEMYPIFDIGFPALLSELSAKTPEEKLIEIFKEARRNSPAIIYLSQLDIWWKLAHNWLKGLLSLLLQELPLDVPLLLLGTCMVTSNELDDDAVSIFDGHVYTVGLPRKTDRDLFFSKLFETTGLSALCKMDESGNQQSDMYFLEPLDGKADGSRKQHSNMHILREPLDSKLHGNASWCNVSTPRKQDKGCLKSCLRKLCKRLLSDQYYKSCKRMAKSYIDNSGDLDQHCINVEQLLQRIDEGYYSKPCVFLRDLQLVLANVKAQKVADEDSVVTLEKNSLSMALDIVSSMGKHLVFDAGKKICKKPVADADARLAAVRTHQQSKSGLLSSKPYGNVTASLYCGDEDILNRIKKLFVRCTKGYSISDLQQIHAAVVHIIKLHNVEAQTRSIIGSLEKYAKGLDRKKRSEYF